VKTLRIFIGSPGDLVEERDRARQVIEQLRRRYVERLGLKAVLWEDLPLQVDMSFQQGIDLVLSSEHGVDIAVFVLWSRLGSPLGPLIQKPDGGEYGSGTEREFDLMLRARAQSKGQRPQILAYTRQDEASFDERLRGLSTADKERMLQQKKQVERFIAEEFHDTAGGTNVRAYHTFDQPVTFSQRLRVHLQELLDPLAESELGNAVWDIEKSGGPFRALESFEFQHAPVFFGREDEIVEARQALREGARNGCPFLLITGPSGSGKSSLARAGVLPAIVDYETDEQVQSWRRMIATPSKLAAHPDGLLGGLSAALAEKDALPELRDDSGDLGALTKSLASSPESALGLAINPALVRATGTKKGAVRLVVLVDQLEELFSDKRLNVEVRTAFVSCLQALTRSGTVWLLVTVRSDFLQHCHAIGLRAGSGVNGQGQLLTLGLPGADAIFRIISEPARMAGLRFEEKNNKTLDAVILSEAAEHRELLPLVEYVLDALFEHRTDDKTLTFAAYEKLGGVRGAVTSAAEGAFETVPESARAELDRLLWLLVTVSGDAAESVVRRTLPLNALEGEPNEPIRKLVGALIARRLLTTSQLSDSTAAVTVAHEVLLRVWNRAITWIGTNRRNLQRRTAIEQAFRRYKSEKENTSLLLPPGLPLEEGRELLRDAQHALNPETIQYIEKSIEADISRQNTKRRIRLFVVAGLGLLAAIASVFGLVATSATRQKSHLLVQAAKTGHAAAEQAMLQDDWPASLALLARSLRFDGSDSALQKFAMNCIARYERRSVAIPVSELRPVPNCLSLLASSDGKQVIAVSNSGRGYIARKAAEGAWQYKDFNLNFPILSALALPEIPAFVISRSEGNAKESPWLIAKIANDTSDPKITELPLVTPSVALDGSLALTWQPDEISIVRAPGLTNIERLKPPFTLLDAQATSGGTVVLITSNNQLILNRPNSESFSPPLELGYSPKILGLDPARQTALVSYDQTLALVDLTAPTPEIKTSCVFNEPVRSATLSRDGLGALLQTERSDTWIWTFSEPAPARTIDRLNLQRVTAGGAPGEFLVQAEDHTIIECLRADGIRRWTLAPGTQISHWAASRDSNDIFTADVAGEIVQWRPFFPDQVPVPDAHEGEVFCVRLNQNGTHLVSCSADRSARLFKLGAEGLTRIALFPHLTAVRGVVFNDTTGLVITAAEDGKIRYWSSNDPQTPRNVVVSSDAKIKLFASDIENRKAVLAFANGTIAMVDLEKQAALTKLPLALGRIPAAVSIASAKDTLVAVALGNEISICHPSDEKCATITCPFGLVAAIGIAPSLERVYAGTDNGFLVEFETGSKRWTVLRAADQRLGGIRSMALDRSGKRLVAGCEHGTIVASTEDGRLLSPILGMSKSCQVVSFSADGATVASGSSRQVISTPLDERNNLEGNGRLADLLEAIGGKKLGSDLLPESGNPSVLHPDQRIPMLQLFGKGH
jgi:WD40 repeat protein